MKVVNIDGGVVENYSALSAFERNRKRLTNNDIIEAIYAQSKKQ
jgi:hypothetical protein